MSKRKQIQHYTTLLQKMIDDLDFRRYFGDEVANKIIKYKDLANYSSINELLPEPFDYRIVLTEQRPNVGHWTCIIKYGDVVEWFDSYGVKPDGEFRYIPTAIRNALGQGGNILTKLMKVKHPHQKLYYNKRKFQIIDDNINTCGRWVIARLLGARCGWELDDFITKVDASIEETGKPADILVCDWIQ